VGKYSVTCFARSGQSCRLPIRRRLLHEVLGVSVWTYSQRDFWVVAVTLDGSDCPPIVLKVCDWLDEAEEVASEYVQRRKAAKLAQVGE
jgi:hypothetical protein